MEEGIWATVRARAFDKSCGIQPAVEGEAVPTYIASEAAAALVQTEVRGVLDQLVAQVEAALCLIPRDQRTRAVRATTVRPTGAPRALGGGPRSLLEYI